MTDRELVERDLEQFAALAPTLGRNAVFEVRDGVLLAIIPECRSNGPDGFQGVFKCVCSMCREWRAHRNGLRRCLRLAARARKARRGWR